MKTIIGIILVAGLTCTPKAHANSYAYGPWLPFGAIVVVGTAILSRPEIVYQQQTNPGSVYTESKKVSVYSTQAPVVQMPWETCELKTEVINGQTISGNFCSSRY